MSGAEPGSGPVDEFDQIARLLRPLTQGAPEALGLLDDAAVIQPRQGMELVITKDAVVAGVHFLPDDPLDLVARKLLRVNLSDLAAMGAEPYAYFLAAAWPPGTGWEARATFAEGLRRDQAAFGLVLLGGDTVSTPGPLSASATVLGWAPAGGSVKRSGARAGDRVLVSGTIGDGFLGLKAARGELDLPEAAAAVLADRYRLPQPRTGLTPWLRAHATAAADVSDGLIADAGHIARASGVGLRVDLDRLPLSPAAQLWLERQPDRAEALAALATGGDDYEIVCTAAAAQGPLTDIGEVVDGEGVAVRLDGAAIPVGRTGWRHA